MTKHLHRVEDVAAACVCDVPQNTELPIESCCEGIQLLYPECKRNELKQHVS